MTFFRLLLPAVGQESSDTLLVPLTAEGLAPLPLLRLILLVDDTLQQQRMVAAAAAAIEAALCGGISYRMSEMEVKATKEIAAATVAATVTTALAMDIVVLFQSIAFLNSKYIRKSI